MAFPVSRPSRARKPSSWPSRRFARKTCRSSRCRNGSISRWFSRSTRNSQHEFPNRNSNQVNAHGRALRPFALRAFRSLTSASLLKTGKTVPVARLPFCPARASFRYNRWRIHRRSIRFVRTVPRHPRSEGKRLL